MNGDSADVEIGVICGPTAGGKSAIALWLADQLPATIIAADSRQIYRRFDVGTAKPSTGERARVPHHGIDVVDPSERYSAAAWVDAADAWIREARRGGRIPLIVGGTGLYLRSMFDGLFAQPALNGERRARLERILSGFELPELRRWVARLDPDRAHHGRAQLMRSIEMALLTGKPMADWHRMPTTASRWKPHYLLVDPGPALIERIVIRTADMLNNGWPEEVEGLMRAVPVESPAWKATGYEIVRRLVTGALTRDAARDAIVVRTRQYAKRQRTWFRHQLPMDRLTRVDPLEPRWQDSVRRWLRITMRADA